MDPWETWQTHNLIAGSGDRRKRHLNKKNHNEAEVRANRYQKVL